jgi:hypothetical protein
VEIKKAVFCSLKPLGNYKKNSLKGANYERGTGKKMIYAKSSFAIFQGILF